ncbi:MAG: FeoB-associated Cys-rich membrane protein [Candidatus Hydrogenedentes bacterium]|nr:FeoB-associated Cys-rich membrane protein [Candidatus Hydrogenedentota bacterium]
MTAQLLIIGVIVCVAAAYLARYAWHAWRGQGGCGCGECPAGKKSR